jgi:glutamate synthase (NADPH/NADH) large chain
MARQIPEEHDACGLWAWVARTADASPDVLDHAFQALDQMSHRAGHVDREGDGAGLLIDLPRRLWSEWLAAAGHAKDAAFDPEFGVGHLWLPEGLDPAELLEGLDPLGVSILHVRRGAVMQKALGPLARSERLVFWQAGFRGPVTFPVLEALWQWEREGVVVGSWSQDSVVYKCRGDGRALRDHFLDWRHPAMRPRVVVGHVRYSTNTTTQVARAQPFRSLAHNGEINTINRLRLSAAELALRLPEGGSDSQDLARLLEALVIREGLGLSAAMSLLFPPVAPIADALPAPWAQHWRTIRAAMGPVAQGPAAIIASHGSTLVASQDALGLRPLWLIETRDGSNNVVQQFIHGTQYIDELVMMRIEERQNRFGERFIALARAVYVTNDKRAQAKKEVNLHLGSKIIEEKSYRNYR